MPSIYYKTEGLVLRKMPFGEADFLARILTKKFGKMDALAKGARKSVSKLNPHLDMLNFVRISFVQNGESARTMPGSDGRLPTLTDAEIIERFDNWFLDADRISVASRILKTIDTLVHAGESDSGLLDIVLMSLRSLNPVRDEVSNWIKDTMNIEEIGNSFAQAFLARQGYGDHADYSLLPPEVADTIIEVWPNLTT